MTPRSALLASLVCVLATAACDGDSGDAGGKSDRGVPESRYCAVALAQDHAGDEWNPMDPASTRTFVEETLFAFELFAGNVPDEITDEFEVVTQNFEAVASALAGRGYDVAALTPEERAHLVDPPPRVQEAMTTVADYEDRECGIEPDDPTAAI
jgi:hypothetical protein